MIMNYSKKQYKMLKIAVTGGLGHIGSALIKELPYYLRESEITIIDNNVKVNDVHLGSLEISRILPVIVHRAIAIIIAAKNRIIISLRPHKINIEIINAVIDSKLVGFNLNI